MVSLDVPFNGWKKLDRKLHRPGTGSPVKNGESLLCEVIAVAPQGERKMEGKRREGK